MNLSFKDQLKEWQKLHGQITENPKNKPENKKQSTKKTEKLSKSDLIYLMGMNRPRYSRGKGGAWRSTR
ncbi:hypothetical protein C0971_15770 [Bacillus methanolicus]|uniref:hypothetical protein n=1 Tax=Bacillus methanolicus TaxID=1471 RepID=UPI00200D6048|nr:hypothetical protein [Bacillus methanolicus]UQD53317.1 hypothetical protein C0971_15770 [Bacillus methanolicus]